MTHTANSTVTAEAQSSTVATSAPAVRVATPDVGGSVPPPAAQDTALPERGTILAFHPDGRIYRGNLIADILRYRELRAQALGGTSLTADELSALTSLEAALRQPPNRAEGVRERRFFRRYLCSFTAKLEYPVGKHRLAFDVTVEDVGAGGTRLHVGHHVDPGQPVTLVIEVSEGDSSTKLFFPARVAWSNDESMGIMFAGSPSRTRDDADSECTLVDLTPRRHDERVDSEDGGGAQDPVDRSDDTSRP
jgi:hypothetical protein